MMSDQELKAPPFYRVEWAIMLAARDIRQTFDFVFSDFKLNLSEVALMALITEHGSLSQSGLAKSLGMGRASLGALVDGLEQRNFVVRKEDPKDKRVWLIELTTAGKEIAVKLEERDQSLREAFREGVGRDERQNLADTLEQLRQNLRSLSKERQ
ncbi:MAG: hypothetical protein CL455_06370 [Acidimicrobiaceae bacterium]|nr:hypothetical protein [Acidimicrobiaceae bacterium]MEC7843926.1 MarR family transcriptional regulator [Actinomycetota bacterium]